MTNARRKRVKRREPDMAERRRWYNNLPSGRRARHWSDDERERKLRLRSMFVDKGITIILSVMMASAVWVMQTREDIVEMQLQIQQLRNDVHQLRSWFGAPAPVNPGR